MHHPVNRVSIKATYGSNVLKPFEMTSPVMLLPPFLSTSCSPAPWRDDAGWPDVNF
jgi:hypothetical protein